MLEAKIGDLPSREIVFNALSEVAGGALGGRRWHEPRARVVGGASQPSADHGNRCLLDALLRSSSLPANLSSSPRASPTASSLPPDLIARLHTEGSGGGEGRDGSAERRGQGQQGGRLARWRAEAVTAALVERHTVASRGCDGAGV